MSGVAFTGGGTGGHLYPMLAIADSLRRSAPDLTVTFMGSASRMEATAVPAAGYPFVALPVISIPRRPGLAMVNALSVLGHSCSQAKAWLRQTRPDVVVGAGGYISVPLVVAAALDRVPIVLLEQNAIPGLATRMLASLARIVCVSFAATVPHLPRAIWTGNPLREGIGHQSRQPERFGLDPARPTLLVMGGSLGARAINTVLAEVLPRLLAATNWQVLHLTGETGQAQAQEAIAAAGIGPDEPRYRALPYCHDMPGVFAVADLALARAGATSVAELAVAGVPTVYVPYPGAGHHQAANAEAAVAAGAARLLLETGLTADSLWKEIEPLLGNPDARLAMASACATIAMPGAAAAVARHILGLLPAGTAAPPVSTQEGHTA